MGRQQTGTTTLDKSAPKALLDSAWQAIHDDGVSL